MTRILTIEMLSYWRAGTGRDRPGTLDATCQREDHGLPMIPGKHLKGLLRDALRRAHDFGWVQLSPDNVFGTREPHELGPGEDRRGAVRVDSAFLPPADRLALADHPELVAQLFEVKRSTAISRETGAAKPGSLRFEEVVVPVTLRAALHPFPWAPDGWDEAIRDSLPLLREVGAHRTRGLGRCRVRMEGEEG